MRLYLASQEFSSHGGFHKFIFCDNKSYKISVTGISMHFLCNVCHVSVNIKSMVLVGLWCFLYISYILLNFWMIGACHAVFAFWKTKRHLFLILRQNIYLAPILWCVKNQNNDLKHPFATEEVEKTLSFWGWEKSSSKKTKAKIKNAYCYLVLFINNKV